MKRGGRGERRTAASSPNEAILSTISAAFSLVRRSVIGVRSPQPSGRVSTLPSDGRLAAGVSAALGRRYVMAAVGLLLLVELTVSGAFIAKFGAERLPQQVVRLLLVVGLGYALLKRRHWARWITVALLVLGCWVLTKPLLAPGAFSGSRLGGSLWLLGLFVAYGLVVRGLIFSSSVQAFFKSGDVSTSDSPPR